MTLTRVMVWVDDANPNLPIRCHSDRAYPNSSDARKRFSVMVVLMQKLVKEGRFRYARISWVEPIGVDKKGKSAYKTILDKEVWFDG